MAAFAQKPPQKLLDRNTKSGHTAGVTNGPSQIKIWLFRLVAVVWLTTAVPICLFSAFFLEIPLWPTFNDQSTPEGIGLWAVIAAFFYITPMVLIFIGRRWNGRSAYEGERT
ncbi:hypothetical protein [Novosphingobium sp. SG707]|uniref:hypothetical protein n=1 Tax=Novosphingobium sp. SG707 TaxID=2586996 RepID=UPI0014461E5F|nr:hypothetical protein [Novosphingobium sp. SG707]NKJ00724.1 hypothetical protein [Novosphingobium sp. SG707]